MSQGPLSNPSPSNSTPAYRPNDPGNAPSLTNPDGSQIREIVAKHGTAQRPAPTLPQPRERTTGRWAAKP
jgi:hypothetical protein